MGLAFISWILVLFVIDLLTIRWFPVPWIDEVMFADPAASLVLHGHWTSTAWYGRGDLTYWSGNVPAYSFLQVPWLWLFGVSGPAVRSLNSVLIACTMACTWFSVKRLNLIPTPSIRLVVLMALSLCYPVAYSVRCGRPDVVGMLLFAMSALFWTTQRRSIGYTGLFCCAVLTPFSGIQYAFYMPILLGIVFWVCGKPAFGRLASIIGGGILGAILLCIYYQSISGWDGLLSSAADVHGRRPPGIWDSFLTLLDTLVFRYYLGRPHFILLICASILLAVKWKRLAWISKHRLVLAVMFLLGPGVSIGFFSHFGVPYHWLAVAPALILLASVASASWRDLGPITQLCCGILALGLATSGRLVLVAIGGILGSSTYTERVEQAAAALVQPGEIIYGDWQIYYAMKPRAGRIYFSNLVPRLTEQERSAITMAFLPADRSDGPAWLSSTFGGHWTHKAMLPAPSPIPGSSKLIGSFSPGLFFGTRLSAYRRESNLQKAEFN